MPRSKMFFDVADFDPPKQLVIERMYRSRSGWHLSAMPPVVLKFRGSRKTLVLTNYLASDLNGVLSAKGNPSSVDGIAVDVFVADGCVRLQSVRQPELSVFA